MLLKYLDREFSYHFTIFLDALYEAWTYHFAIIGYCVIKSTYRNRWHICLIAYTHPW